MRKREKDLKEALNKPKQIKEILDEQIQTAMHEHNRSNQDLFLSSISAGLEIGFSVFLMAVLYTLFGGLIHPSLLMFYWLLPTRSGLFLLLSAAPNCLPSIPHWQ